MSVFHKRSFVAVLATFTVASMIMLSLTVDAGRVRLDNSRLNTVHDTQSVIDHMIVGGQTLQQAMPTMPALNFLEMSEKERGAVDPITNCPAGVFCPHTNGRCCPGAKFCCADICIGDKYCGTTAQQNALAVARKAMEEEGHKQIQDVLNRRNMNEAPLKVNSESKRKAANEMAHKEARGAKEEAHKQGVFKDEERSKHLDGMQEEQRKRADSKTKLTRDQNNAESEEKSKADEQQAKTDQQKAAHARLMAKKEREARRHNSVRELKLHNFHPTQDFIVAQASEIHNTGSFTYMFWIRPEGTLSSWSGFLHKGRTNRDRNPSFYMFPNSTRIYVRSGTAQSPNNGVAPVDQLEMHRWTHVALTHTKGYMAVFFDGQKIADKTCNAPLMNGAPLTAMSTFPEISHVTLADVRYYPIAATGKEIRKQFRARRYDHTMALAVQLTDSNVGLGHGSVLADHSKFSSQSDAYSLMFWIYPFGTASSWTNILHRGNENTERSPAIFFHPGTLQLRVRSGDRTDLNAGGDAPKPLALNTWSHVTVQHQSGSLRLLVDGQVSGEWKLKEPLQLDAPLYAGSPWYPAAQAYLADVKYAAGYVTQENILQTIAKKAYNQIPDIFHVIQTRPIRPKTNTVLAQAGSLPRSPAYTYMFWVYFTGNSSSWTELFHKGDTNRARGPALFVRPNSTMLHVRMATADSWNDGVQPAFSFPLHQWTHVGLTHTNGLVELYINGKLQEHYSKPAPVQNDGTLWGCSQWYSPAKAYIADLRYLPKQASPVVFDETAKERKYLGFPESIMLEKKYPLSNPVDFAANDIAISTMVAAAAAANAPPGPGAGPGAGTGVPAGDDIGKF
jgi:Concanavalin A-like lectin/glucanases superfamily